MVLPPGYEDVLLCPPGSCVGRAPVPAGFAGPQSSFFQCVAYDGSTSPVKAWGRSRDIGELIGALQAGYGTQTCVDQPAAEDVQQACWPCWDPAMRDLPRGMSSFCAEVCDRIR
jgi:hypothetical protein